MTTITAPSVTVTCGTVTPPRIPLKIVARPATPHRVTVQTLCSPGFRRTVSYRQAMRTVVDYLHEHRLQNLQHRTHFRLDPVLRRLFQIPSTTEQWTYQELSRFLRSQEGGEL